MRFRPAASKAGGPEGDGKDMLDLAIVGGGPGGLMSAWYLKKKLGDLCRVTIYEASDRVGGKIVSRKFDSAPAMYEAGVAEIYDYSMTGPDPLRELIQHFGLQTIQNGNEQLIECLRSEVDAEIQLNHRVLKVGKTNSGRYQLNMMNGKGPETRDFDLVLMCLPHSWLATMRWDGEELRKSMVRHVAYFDHPAHYLRVSILFDEPFWGEKIPGAWFMSEAFGGCCVYNEGARHDVGKHGVLNWLIAGSDALSFANLSDQELIDAALKSLPASLGNARDHFMEGKIHRWLSSVNALPGGLPVRDVMTNHRPEPKEHQGIVVVGDYLFDSTLNCLLDSSAAATDIIVTEMMKLRRARREGASDRIDRGYFENYRG